MRAIIVCYLALIVTISLLTGAAIALHQQAADNAGVAAYQQQFGDYAKAAGAYR